MAVAVVIVGLVQTIAFPSIARAGFFDLLFGEPFQSRAVRPYEAYPGQWGAHPRFRRHADRGFHKHEHKLTVRRKLNAADEMDYPGRPPAPADIMDDDSLRPGDAVMTANGIRIFIGLSGTPHAPQDFRKLSEINGFSKRERKALAALDAQVSGPNGNPGMATGRSASELKLVFGETITDPRGRSIRYVGP
ncbi:MAG: hypothetical protein DLM68_06785 [Hyphomicrobiales bacterium]|nr:MAG: hypothetical protein DLM68_06785 [Hyphomicrobiales bacterium]